MLNKFKILGLFLSLNMTSCKEKSEKTNFQNNSEGQRDTPINDSSTMLESNLKLHFPNYKLTADSSKKDLSLYSQHINIDTAGASEFLGNRDFLGKLNNIQAVKVQNRDIIYLKSFDLKLWVYNLEKVAEKIPDTVLISPIIYGIRGNEKVIGFPSIVTEIKF